MPNYAVTPANIQNFKNEYDSFSLSKNFVNKNNVVSFGADRHGQERVIKWGILGTGKMATNITEAMKFAENTKVQAVASRMPEKSEGFAQKWDIPSHYGSYEALLKDPKIDVVYIATPAACHYENILQCLKYGKNVLCEKPFVLNQAQAEEVFTLAKKKNLFLMEAYWSQFLPGYNKIKELIDDGAIGDVVYTEAKFFHRHEPVIPTGRQRNLNLGGGALLDLGFYPIGLALMVSGFPTKIDSTMVKGDTGVDLLDTIVLTHENGSRSMLSCAMNSNAPREALIVGTKGYIKIPAPGLYSPKQLILNTGNKGEETIDVELKGNGYNYEIEEVNKCLRDGKIESAIHKSLNTINILKIMDTVRKKGSLVYPQEVQY